MSRATKYTVVLVTTSDLRIARRLSAAALKARLIACANLVPKIESHYWWRGKIEKGSEVLVLMKTTRPKLRALEKLIIAEHPYETPEFLAIPVDAGNARYLKWIDESVGKT